MNVYRPLVAALLCATVLTDAAWAQSVERRVFAQPPASYRPTVTLEEGAGYAASFEDAAHRAIFELDAGGIMINPQGDPARDQPMDLAAIMTTPIGLLNSYPPHATPWLEKALPGEARFGTYLADGKAGPGKPPSLGYLTPEWFASIRGVLETARKNGRYAIFYDEAGFPSGSADRTIPPQYYRKLLRREEVTVSSFQSYTLDLSKDRPLAVVAFDTASGKRIDVLALAKGDRIDWTAPRGNWRVQRYFVTTAQAGPSSPDYYGAADYLDREATQWFIDNSYARVHAGMADQFGAPIRFTFFDDVGILADEKTWHPSVAERFEKITGKPAALYYPALWDDIGPDTGAARVAFYRARAEILGETFPKMITDWAHAHGVKATGHAPGNYDIQPTDTIGDPFKFYAYTDVPMADVLWGVGFARGGFKLISSVSAQRDLPLTAAEAFSVNSDANGYRRTIELYVRGFNQFITGARVPSKPLTTGAEFNQWAGRSSYLLQGGRHVADIAVLFPIESLQAFYAFNAPTNSSDLPWGVHAYQDADYQAVGEMLLSDLHRDFTFVHPDALAGDKIKVTGPILTLDNKVNNERYRVLVLPGGEVLSAAALAKVKAFWEAGGIVVATSKLPSRSAEFGRDADVKAMVSAMFGDNAVPAAEPQIRRSAGGGQAVFIGKPDAHRLGEVLTRLGVSPDVAFEQPSAPRTGNGVFGYIHRQRDGKDIYYFGNSSDTPIETAVTLRGRLTRAQFWNPHTGAVTDIPGVRYRDTADGEVTEFVLKVAPVSTMAVVGVQRPAR